jgi:hypothetical protein
LPAARASVSNFKMVLLSRIELPTSPLPRECSTTELQQLAKPLTPWHINHRMTETQDPKNKPQASEKLKQKPVQKPLSPLEAKRAQNLRDNLLKRKQQARARSEEPKD